MGKENIPNWRSDLRNALNKYFSEDDLSVIAFDLGLKLDTIVSFNKNKTQRIIGLIEYCEQTDRIKDLIDACRSQRPNVNWDEMARAAEIDKAKQFQENTPPIVTEIESEIPLTQSNSFWIFGVLIVAIVIIGLNIFLRYQDQRTEAEPTNTVTMTPPSPLAPLTTSTIPATATLNEQSNEPTSNAFAQTGTTTEPLTATFVPPSTAQIPTETPTQSPPTNTHTPIPPTNTITPTPPTPDSNFPSINFEDPFEVEIKPEWEGRDQWKFTAEHMIVPDSGTGTLLLGDKNWNHYVLNIQTLQPPFDAEGRPTRTAIILSECSKDNGDLFRLFLILESKSESNGTGFFYRESTISPNAQVGGVFTSTELENAFTPNTNTSVQIITTADQVYASVNGVTLPILDVSDPGLINFVDCWNENNLDYFSGRVGLTGTNNWQSQFDNFSIKSLELIYENGFENDITTNEISETEGISLIQHMPGNNSDTSIMISKLDDSTSPRGVVFWFRGSGFSQIFDKENKYLLQIDYRSSDRSKCKLTFGINDDPANRINHPNLQGEDYWQTTQLMPLFIPTSVNQIQLTLYTNDQNKSCEYDNLRIYKVPSQP